jgi:AcrR family transcriptional regulator
MESQGGVRRRRGRSQATREQIVAAAAQLLAEQGYMSTSLDQVAAQAGLTRGAIYYHFESKEALYWEVVGPALGRAQQRLRERSEKKTDPALGLREFLHNTLRTAQNPQSRYLWYQEMIPLDEEMRRKARDEEREFERLLADLIARGQDDGLFVEGDPKIIALIIISAISRSARWYDPEGPVPVAEFVDVFSRLVLNGLLTGAGRERVATAPDSGGMDTAAG